MFALGTNAKPTQRTIMTNALPTFVSSLLMLTGVVGLLIVCFALATAAISLPLAGMSILIFTGALVYAINMVV